MNTEKAIELLEEYKARCWQGPGQELAEGRERINQVLALLKQPCKTCKGSGKVPTKRSIGFGAMNTIMDTCPNCWGTGIEPDCQQPEAGEFTKEFRKFIEKPLTRLRLQRWHTKSREACTIIDSQAEEIKQLQAKIETLKAAFHGDSAIVIIEELETKIEKLKEEIAKLNVILYHRENGLAHPDFNAEIEISKQAERIKELEQLVREKP